MIRCVSTGLIGAVFCRGDSTVHVAILAVALGLGVQLILLPGLTLSFTIKRGTFHCREAALPKLVKSISAMDDETLIKHLNARHLWNHKQGPGALNYPKVMQAWRGWHESRHFYDEHAPEEFKIPEPHEHREEKE